MIYCELFVCLREVVEGSVKPDLHHSPAALQDEVAKAWLREHSPEFSKHEDEKIWDYPESLKLGLPS